MPLAVGARPTYRISRQPRCHLSRSAVLARPKLHLVGGLTTTSVKADRAKWLPCCARLAMWVCRLLRAARAGVCTSRLPGLMRSSSARFSWSMKCPPVSSGKVGGLPKVSRTQQCALRSRSSSDTSITFQRQWQTSQRSARPPLEVCCCCQRLRQSWWTRMVQSHGVTSSSFGWSSAKQMRHVKGLSDAALSDAAGGNIALHHLVIAVRLRPSGGEAFVNLSARALRLFPWKSAERARDTRPEETSTKLVRCNFRGWRFIFRHQIRTQMRKKLPTYCNASQKLICGCRHRRWWKGTRDQRLGPNCVRLSLFISSGGYRVSHPRSRSALLFRSCARVTQRLLAV